MPITLRRTLGTLTLVALLAAGCGSDDSGPGDGGAGDDDAGKVLASPEAAKVTQVAIVTGTAAGGRVTSEPTRLPDEDAVRSYVEQFRNDRFQGEIVRAAAAADAEVPEGQELAAAVVAIGCEVPSGVVGTATGDDVSVQAVLPSPDKQCLAPITSVALVLLPA